MSLYCQHLLGKSLFISTVQDIHSLCGLLTCGINGISLKMDFGESFSVEGFSEGDDVVITYTGTLENEEKPPVITAMEAAQ